MSVQMKAMYYPGKTLIIEQTRFGMPKIPNISLYQQPVAGKTILKVDLLESLRTIWGDGLLLGRDYAYILVSGDGVTDDRYREILTSCYKRFAAFANYCDECYYFGDQTLSLHERFLQPVRELLDHERAVLSTYGRVLAESDGYMYLAFPKDEYPKDLKGVSGIYA